MRVQTCGDALLSPLSAEEGNTQQQFEEIPAPVVVLLASIAAPAEAIQTLSVPVEETSRPQNVSFEALLAQIEQENQRATQRIKRLSLLMLCSTILPLSYIIVLQRYYMPRHLLSPLWPNYVYMAIMSGVALLFIGNLSRYGRPIAEMTQMDDMRVVGPLIDYLINGELHSAVEDALTRLLPRVQASDAEQFTPARRDRLCRELARNRSAFVHFYPLRRQNPAYAVAILKAFEQVGGEFELPEARALTNGSIKGVSPSVQAAARECLPFLEQRVHAQQSRVELLRAASSSIEASGQLLRAATDNTADTPPDELLRAQTVLPSSYQAAQTVEEAANITLQAGL